VNERNIQRREASRGLYAIAELLIKSKGSGFIYRLICSISHSRRSGTDNTFYQQITPHLPLPRKRSPDGTSPD